MSNMTRGMSGSVFLHGALLLSLLSLGGLLREPPKTLVIDFSITKTAPPAPGENRPSVAPPAAPQPETVAKQPPLPPEPRVVAPKPAVVPEITPVRKKSIRQSAETPAELPQTKPVMAPSPAVTEGAGNPENNNDSNQQLASTAPDAASPPENPDSPSGALSPAPAPAVPEESGSGAAEAGERYVKAHFIHIKEGIQRNISYPLLARKKGWEGKVLVSFIICENGRVADLHIVKSSGFEVLDNNAVTTIKKLEPFPCPPVRAELIVPVVYSLS
ncbi:MAG: energy transducer TonB [Deltaproteobacteria bacterium]|nr:energy transducer TonB [Deltaproteobacteria bacterium]